MPVIKCSLLSLTLLLAQHARPESGSSILRRERPKSASTDFATCPTGTINYITHSLPQQCLHTSWETAETAPSHSSLSFLREDGPSVEHMSLVLAPTSMVNPLGSLEDSRRPNVATDTDTGRLKPMTVDQRSTQATSVSSTPVLTMEEPSLSAESEADSPLDNARFLSFEDWKQQNLAQAGQSVENVGKETSLAGEVRGRRPGINNALDTLGEDTEIELDFNAFKAPPGPTIERSDGHQDLTAGDATHERSQILPPTATKSRNKDAGKTCKERFNYASFDCAANVLKTNPECKSASSVLIEHKDSYMLNQCSAENKFLIVELCEHIHIDTVVLANFEFFSSMFQTFRVSVSDRYPVKIERWKELGTYAARNAREIQAFLVEEPQIWARYLRIEFLTHYGNEYYCPLSLLRVHGTTMMEEFRQEEEAARGEIDIDAEENPVVQSIGNEVGNEAQIVGTALDAKSYGLMGKSTTDEQEHKGHTIQNPEQIQVVHTTSIVNPQLQHAGSTARSTLGVCLQNLSSSTLVSDHTALSTCHRSEIVTSTLASNPTSKAESVIEKATTPTPSILPHDSSREINSTSVESVSLSSRLTTNSPSSSHMQSNAAASLPNVTQAVEAVVAAASITTSSPNLTSANATSVHTRSNANDSGPTSSHLNIVSSSGTPIVSPLPPSNVPSTQESFFKSIHKRLQALESNATLSLQYIESQSQLLRDAFAKVERRNLAKTSTFLEALNTTVLAELSRFKADYEQLWQSTVLELASRREEGRQEREAMGERIRMLGDEMVSQKRLMAAQATLMLLCLGLLVFVRIGPAVNIDSRLIQSVDGIRRRTIKGSEALGKVWHWDAPQRSPWATPPRSSPSTRPATSREQEGAHFDSNDESELDNDAVHIEQPRTDRNRNGDFLEPSIGLAVSNGETHVTTMKQTQSAPTTPQFETAPIFTNTNYDLDSGG